MTPNQRARDALDEAPKRGWTGPTEAKEYAAECLIAYGFDPKESRRYVAQAWAEKQKDEVRDNA